VTDDPIAAGCSSCCGEEAEDRSPDRVETENTSADRFAKNQPAPTFEETMKRWEATATVKFHPNLDEALREGCYSQADLDDLTLALLWQVDRQIEHQANLHPQDEAAALARTFDRLSRKLAPPVLPQGTPVVLDADGDGRHLTDTWPFGFRLEVDASVVQQVVAKDGDEGFDKMRAILCERLEALLHRSRNAILRPRPEPTAGDRYLQRYNKASRYFPDGAAGELLRAFEQRLSTYFGSTGLVTMRLYDLLKVAGVVPDRDEPWERSRARAARTELHNAVCYATIQRVTGEVRDRLVEALRDDQPCNANEAKTKLRVGRDFADRNEFEEWLLGRWLDWMSQAAVEAQRLGSFTLEERQLGVWNGRVAELFGQKGRGRSGSHLTTDDVLTDLLSFCQDTLTNELLGQIPMRDTVKR
jgi:hypothetical protein